LRPVIFSTFLMWLLAELFAELDEVGDVDRPKLVFFFDEAHLLFADASKAGALIDGDRIPAFPDLPRYGPRLGINVRDAVLHGGEEYALLFTSALRESELSARVGRPVYAVGRVTEELGVRINSEILEPRGFDHFDERKA